MADLQILFFVDLKRGNTLQKQRTPPPSVGLTIWLGNAVFSRTSFTRVWNTKLSLEGLGPVRLFYKRIPPLPTLVLVMLCVASSTTAKLPFPSVLSSMTYRPTLRSFPISLPPPRRSTTPPSRSMLRLFSDRWLPTCFPSVTTQRHVLQNFKPVLRYLFIWGVHTYFTPQLVGMVYS